MTSAILFIILSENDISETDIYEATMRNNKDENLERFYNAFIPVMHLFHNLAIEVSKGAEFSLAQYRVLMLVHQKGSISVKELKSKLNIAQSTASEMMERLVKQNLLYREKDPKDRRVTLFKLTNKTRKILQNQKTSVIEVLRKTLEPLNEKERKSLIEAFETISNLLA
ncbi:hypothetical protein DRQ09_09845, partial [candidate division KSB1 bacterium]